MLLNTITEKREIKIIVLLYDLTITVLDSKFVC